MSAQCFTVGTSGELIAQAVPPSECTGFVLMDKTDYMQAQSAMDLWAIDPAANSLMFFTSFSLVVTCFLVSWGYGELLSFIERH